MTRVIATINGKAIRSAYPNDTAAVADIRKSISQMHASIMRKAGFTALEVKQDGDMITATFSPALSFYKPIKAVFQLI